MKHTFYPSTKDLNRQVVWKENIKAIALAVAMGAGMAALIFFQLSK